MSEPAGGDIVEGFGVWLHQRLNYAIDACGCEPTPTANHTKECAVPLLFEVSRAWWAVCVGKEPWEALAREAGMRRWTRESQSAAGDGVKCENCGELITAAVYCTLCDKTLCYDCDAMVEHAEAHPI